MSTRSERRKRLIRGLADLIKYEGHTTALSNSLNEIRVDASEDDVALSHVDPGKVSYRVKGKDVVVRTTLTRYMRRRTNLPKDYPDHELDRVCCTVMGGAFFETHGSLKVTRGEGILEVYEAGPYSCMAGAKHSFTQLYADNPDKVGMVYAIGKEGDIQARALLWDTDSGEKYMDRTHTGRYDDKYSVPRGALIIWAKEHGYDNTEHARGEPWQPDPNPMVVTLCDSSNGKYPYMDTLCYGRWADGGRLQVCNEKNRGTTEFPIYMNSEHGNLTAVQDDECGDEEPDDD